MLEKKKIEGIIFLIFLNELQPKFIVIVVVVSIDRAIVVGVSGV